jgi:hypothetical protein
MRWEYKTTKYKKRNFFSGGVDIEILNVNINAMAKEGWELVSLSPHYCWGAPCGLIVIYKRQK